MITVLTGENDYAISRAVRQLVHDFVGEAERFEGTSLEPGQLPDICAGATLFATDRLVVIADASDNKPLWGELEQWVSKVPETTHLVLVEPHPDKRTKTYKQLISHGEVRDHKLLDTPSLIAWLQAKARESGMDMPRDEAQYLVTYVGHDQWRLRSELQKLLLSEKPINRDLIHEITEPYPEASAFELLDSVFAGKLDRAEELLELLSEREDPYLFLGLLSSQLMAMLAIATGGQRRNDEIARDVGVHPFVIQKLGPVVRRIGREGVIDAVDKLAECDVRIKTSGVEPWDQLRRTLLTIS